jgi:hypothetical protein
MALSNQVTPVGGTSAKAVTPSDTAAFPPSVIYVGGTGNVNVMPADGIGPVVFASAAAGSALPVLAIQVYSTSTTATNIVRVG